jgi:hypothetical protein
VPPFSNPTAHALSARAVWLVRPLL